MNVKNVEMDIHELFYALLIISVINTVIIQLTYQMVISICSEDINLDFKKLSCPLS